MLNPNSLYDVAFDVHAQNIFCMKSHFVSVVGQLDAASFTAATDLDLSLRTSCAAKVKKEGSCTVPARKLYDYVKLLPDGVEDLWSQDYMDLISLA